MAKKSYFFINDDATNYYHIFLQKPVEISGLEPIVKKIHVPGRNGDLILETGAYKNRKAKAKCYIANTHPNSQSMSDVMKSAMDFLFKHDGYFELKTYEDMDHFFMARIAKGPSMAPRQLLLNPFNLEFDCKPQRFRKDGKPLTIYRDFAKSFIVKNPGSGVALPLLRIFGNGAGGIQIGDTKIFVTDIRGNITIDCDTQDAYSGNPLVNRNNDIQLVTGDYPSFAPGNNTVIVAGSGVTSVDVIPRWWDK